jgi:arylsulfatase A-like enzyme
MWNDFDNPNFPRHPGKVSTMAQMKTFFDNYDCGIKYTDDQVGMIVNLLKEQGIYDDVCFVITSDHGENMGELGLYAEHGTADEPTCHIPMIIKWIGGASGMVDREFHDNTDLCPTVSELLGVSVDGGYRYDGISYAQTVKEGAKQGRENLVLTQCAHVCQRSARFGDYIYIRTVHGGGHLYDDEMLFNVKEDPHQLRNIVKERPDLAAQGAKIILDWVDAQMKVSIYDTDPMWTVMREGGPEHARGEIGAYMKRLEGTARDYGVAALAEKYPWEVDGIPKKW